MYSTKTFNRGDSSPEFYTRLACAPTCGTPSRQFVEDIITGHIVAETFAFKLTLKKIRYGGRLKGISKRMLNRFLHYRTYYEADIVP